MFFLRHTVDKDMNFQGTIFIRPKSIVYATQQGTHHLPDSDSWQLMERSQPGKPTTVMSLREALKVRKTICV